MTSTHTPVRTRRSRADTVRANDRAIQDAVLRSIAEVGWDATSLSGVAKLAGLTVGALYNRAESKSELGNAVWSDAVQPWLSDQVDRILSAGEAGDASALGDAFATWEGDQVLGVSVTELLIASLFDDELDEVVGRDARRIMGRIRSVDGGATALPDHVAAANTLNLSMAFGRLLARTSHPGLPALSREQVAVAAAFAGARSQQRRPEHVPAVEFLREPEAESEQTHIDTATLSVIGRVGYRRATIARISRAAGMSTGRLFSRYDSKAQLVHEAVGRLLKSPVEMWEDYAPVVAEQGPLMARALWVSDVLESKNASHWALDLELARVARFIPELADLQVAAEAHHHTNLGVMFVGSFSEGLASLPFEDPFSAGSTTR